MKMKLRMLGIFVAAMGVAGAMFTAPGPASANPNSGHVTVRGFANCREAVPKLATSVRIQAANGEAVEGQVNPITQFYSVSFNRVPENGEQANAYVFCQSGATPWGKAIYLTRPRNFSTVYRLDLTK